MPQRKTMLKYSVTTDKLKPESVEILAENLKVIADSFKKVLNSGLSKRAIIVLIKDRCSNSLSMNQIETVLDEAANLDKFLKK